jgi:hypothetical protein
VLTAAEVAEVVIGRQSPAKLRAVAQPQKRLFLSVPALTRSPSVVEVVQKEVTVPTPFFIR